VQLTMLIEEFLTPDQYVKNAQLKDHGADRVEYAIKFKGGAGEDLLLPVDAKFPRADYERLIEASELGDPQTVQNFRRLLENRIKLCAKDIKDKYICPPRTTDFAILFLPTESLYAEALRLPGLFEHLQRECHVTLAGPTTFSAILNAFRMNFHSQALAKQTSEIWRVLRAVRTEFSRYNNVVGSLDRQLRAAANSVESLGRRTRAMDRKLQTVEVLPDDGSAQELLGLEDQNIELDDDAEYTNGHLPVPPGPPELNGPEDTLPQ
jgi:DNA recombination protein RmuC